MVKKRRMDVTIGRSDHVRVSVRTVESTCEYFDGLVWRFVVRGKSRYP